MVESTLGWTRVVQYQASQVAEEKKSSKSSET